MRRSVMLLFVVAALLGPAGTAVAAPKAPAGIVSLHDVAPSILMDIRYDTPHNFIGRPIKGYRQPLCILTRPAAEALARVQDRMLARGYSLKVYDCYRPQRAVDDFVRWGKRVGDQTMKAEFYPHVDKRVVFKEGYIATKSGHSRGSTMDLTLVRLPARPQAHYRPGQNLVSCTAPAWQRFRDNSIDMGTGYDCFDPLAHPLNKHIKGKQHRNRLVLRHAMLAQGFTPLATEWWHFTLADEPYPDTYFDFPVSRSSLP
jgi:D-alanyl-D-alanine dipeptidase